MKKVTVEWANEQQTAVLVTYHTNDWEWSDLVQAFDQQRILIEQTRAQVVHVIVDVIKSQFIPKGGNLLTVSFNVNRNIHPKQGDTIIVGARGMIARMIDISDKLPGARRRKFLIVPTLPAAYDLIANLSGEAGTHH